ncbi:MAG TPA: DeoR/GlpR family DNA-binding transcription regulator [Albidovulum sp.]|uniref:DeoR/GlpR family DNA-binding transcription regulator n=1 Tax=Albidovulum sp. TaxID=1872424 RepID=UPI002BF818B9|nr:DeoR/GlpR family DNA-binding transcription regulator [Albidovulum sp.]
MPQPLPDLRGKSLVDIVAADIPHLNKTYRSIAEYLVGAPEDFMQKPVQEIAVATGVSEPSIVRFCRRYGLKGIPDFRIQLAMSLARGNAASRFVEPELGDKAMTNLPQKRAIATAAREMAVNFRSIIIDSGSTAQLFAELLRDADPMVILTTGLNIVDALRGAKQHTIILPGGELRHESRSLSGRMVENTIANMRFDAVFLGADSIDPQFGLSTFNLDEAQQNASMIDIVQHVFVLADSSKFGAPSLHRVCDLGRIETIITDAGLSEELATAITTLGVDLRRVAASKEQN